MFKVENLLHKSTLMTQKCRILNCADFCTLAYTLKIVPAHSYTIGIEYFLFDGVKVKCGKSKALFFIVIRPTESPYKKMSRFGTKIADL